MCVVPSPTRRVAPTRVFAIVNPVHRGAAQARSMLLSSCPHAVVLETTADEPGEAQARAALASHAELIVVIGGDGTVRLAAGVLAGTGVRLGVVPTGTANLFARNLGLAPRRLAATVDAALHGVPRAIDLGRATLTAVDDTRTDEPFLVLAGIGHDAATVLDTRATLKRRLRWLAYFESGARHLLRRPLRMTLRADDGPAHDIATWCVLAANCGRLPGGVRAFPDARPDDGRLDTLWVPLTSPVQWAQIAAKGVLRLQREVPALRYGTARTLAVTPERPAPAQIDGDAFPEVTALSATVEPAALTVMTARKKGRR